MHLVWKGSAAFILCFRENSFSVMCCVSKASFHCRGQEFIRVGYYVNNDYGDPELRETQPPSAPQFDKLQRNILATNPRVTRFKVWLACRVTVQAVVILCEGYDPEKFHANWNCTNWTYNSHLKHCISWRLGDWSSNPLWYITTPLVDIWTCGYITVYCIYSICVVVEK